MEDDEFTRGLNIVACCLSVANDELLAEEFRADSPDSTQRLTQIRKTIENCGRIINALKEERKAQLLLHTLVLSESQFQNSGAIRRASDSRWPANSVVVQFPRTQR